MGVLLKYDYVFWKFEAYFRLIYLYEIINTDVTHEHVVHDLVPNLKGFFMIEWEITGDSSEWPI